MSKPNFPTKAELLELIADRKNDLQRNSPEFTPPWVHDSSDPDWKHIRERERKITRQTNRLSKSKQEFDEEFDINS